MRGLSRWLPAILWALLLLVLGDRPASELPSGGVLEIPGADKAAHAAAYALLGLSFSLAPRGRGSGLVLLGVAAGLVVGGLDEWNQQWSPGRDASAADLAADVAGALAGALAGARLRTLRGAPRSRGERGPAP